MLHQIIENAGTDDEKATLLADVIFKEKEKNKTKIKKTRKKQLLSFLNTKDYQSQRPLYRAVKQGLVECVRLLTFHGADPNMMSTKYKLTPLMVAAQLGFSEILHHLASSGS